jgi:hypothetical protein
MMSIGANLGRPTSSIIALLFMREHIPDNNAWRSFSSRLFTIYIGMKTRLRVRPVEFEYFTRPRVRTFSTTYLQCFLPM